MVNILIARTSAPLVVHRIICGYVSLRSCVASASTSGKSMILFTGGGVIGAYFVPDWLAQSGEPVVNLDKLTCVSNREDLVSYRQ